MSNLYWDTLFNCNEWVNSSGSVKETRSMPVSMAKVAPHQYVCVNPLQVGKSRKQRNLGAYRNFVIERDGDESIEDQLAWADSIGLPYATAVHSGNKSVHFVIALEYDVGSAEYKKLAMALKTVLPGVDKSCIEAARLTRAPAANQPVLVTRNRISPKDLEVYCMTHGYNFDEADRKVAKKIDKFGETLTMRTMGYLAGNSKKEDAHGDSIHAAKNLFEIGYDYERVLQSMMAARMLYLEEPMEICKEKSEKIVSWVHKEWLE